MPAPDAADAAVPGGACVVGVACIFNIIIHITIIIYVINKITPTPTPTKPHTHTHTQVNNLEEVMDEDLFSLPFLGLLPGELPRRDREVRNI